MTLNKAKGRMFKSVGWTWNPVTGCDHDCPYCWARSMAERYGRSFTPHLTNARYDKIPDDNSWIFVGSTGDLFCPGMGDGAIREVLMKIENYTGSCKFLLQTKNPLRAIEWLQELERNHHKIIIGTTIETNRETFGKAICTRERYASLAFFKNLGFKTFLSLEPLADFDYQVMNEWVETISPEAVEIGLENYTHYTIKPEEDKIIQLLNALDYHGIQYVLKDNLKHLEEK